MMFVMVLACDGVRAVVGVIVVWVVVFVVDVDVCCLVALLPVLMSLFVYRRVVVVCVDVGDACVVFCCVVGCDDVVVVVVCCVVVVDRVVVCLWCGLCCC